MYGSFHQISVWNAPGNAVLEPTVIADPLCESGDVFTRDETGYYSLAPCQRCRLVISSHHDAGAYGYTMSSNYNSLGRAPRSGLKTVPPTSSPAEKPLRISSGLNALPLSSHTSLTARLPRRL
jgi:hypothetical protein